MPVSCENKDIITNVVAKLYQNNIQNKERSGNIYELTDLATLWYIKTSGYWRRLLLACFMCKTAFADKSAIQDCCDSCIYNCNMTKDIPDFLLHDATAIMSTKYDRTPQFIKLRISAEREKLLATAARVRTARTPEDIILACEKALDRFATQKWPTNCLNVIRFPRSWRQ